MRGSRRERQIADQLAAAQAAWLQDEDLPRAVSLQRRAIAGIRELAGGGSADPRHTRALASALYGLAPMLTESGQPTEAIDALDECQRAYEALRGWEPAGDVDLLIADVTVRRANALSVAGRGASAVPEVDAAITAYVSATGEAPDHPRAVDLARVYAMGAVVLAHHGDPDLAAAAADRALRFYLTRRAGEAQFAVEGDKLPYLLMAGAVAAAVHGQQGRIEVAVAAALIAAQFLPDPDLQPRLQDASAAIDAMSPAERRAFGARMAEVLRTGPTMEDITDPLVEPIAAAVDSLRPAARLELGGWTDPLPTVTLSAALGDDALAAELTRPALDVAIATPSDRCTPDLAPVQAGRLSRVARELLAASTPERRTAGLRVGLEAHVLFAIASARRVTVMRHRFGDVGPDWGEVLLACSAEAEARGDAPLALDLAAWAGGVATQLGPFALLDTEVAALARRCVERHGELLIAGGDRAAGEQALAAARMFGD